MYRLVFLCLGETELASRLLDYASDETEIRRQDSYIAVRAVAGNKIGRYLAWDWLRGNWATLKKRFGGGLTMLGSFVKSTTRNIYTEFQLEEVKRFTKSQGDLGSSKRAFTQAKEAGRNNIKYLEKNLADITNWLSQKSNRNSTVV